MELNDYFQFYQKQIKLPALGFNGQEKLKKAKVLMVGLGGLGHPALLHLVAAGAGTVGLCDFDVVEKSNLHRQFFFTLKDIGRPKTQAVAEKLAELNPWTQIREIPLRVSPENGHEIFSSYDLIIDGTDHLPTKFFIHDACFLLQKNLVQAAIYQFEGQVQTFPFAENREEGCWRCLWPLIPSENCVENCQEAGVLGVVAGIFGGLEAMESIKLLTQKRESYTPQTLWMNLLSFETQKIAWKKNAHCPLCGTSPSLHSLHPNNYLSLKSFKNSLNENEEGIEIEKDLPREKEARDAFYQKYTLVDLRETEERFFSPWPLSPHSQNLGLIHWPLSSLLTEEQILDPQKFYLFFCQKGIRSRSLAIQLRKKGWSNVYSLRGGIEELEEINLPAPQSF